MEGLKNTNADLNHVYEKLKIKDKPGESKESDTHSSTDNKTDVNICEASSETKTSDVNGGNSDNELRNVSDVSHELASSKSFSVSQYCLDHEKTGSSTKPQHNLPGGWTLLTKRRNNGLSEGKYDIYYVTPTNSKCRSLPDIHKYASKHNLVLDFEQFSFSVSSLLQRGILNESSLDIPSARAYNLNETKDPPPLQIGANFTKKIL